VSLIRRIQIWHLFIMTILTIGCGPLPKAKNFHGTLDKWPLSRGSTGLAMISTDASFTSSDIYFYNFGTGELYPLATGESGDVTTKWDGRNFWIFNRASGKVSYSKLSPKAGPSTRNSERRTPEADAYDPADWIELTANEAAFAMGTTNKVVIGSLDTATAVASNLSEVNTGQASVPFRPGILLNNYGSATNGTKTSSATDFAVVHQALTSTWKALGGGQIFLAHRSAEGIWGWSDQNTEATGVQGISLTISNPVSSIDCDESAETGATCLLAGACYSSMGTQCVAGVDAVDWSFYKSTRHVFDWPAGVETAGGIQKGAKSGQIIACLKTATEANAKLTVFDSTTGATLATWDVGASTCGPFEVDRDGARIFAIQNGTESSTLYSLTAELNQISKIDLGFRVSSLEAINE
jgi:hypothetical protein